MTTNERRPCQGKRPRMADCPPVTPTQVMMTTSGSNAGGPLVRKPRANPIHINTLHDRGAFDGLRSLVACTGSERDHAYMPSVSNRTSSVSVVTMLAAVT